VLIDGKSVRGRKNRWGVVNVEDANHCEFVHLRNFLTRLVHVINTHERLLSVGAMLLGHTCRTLSRRPHKSTTRRSGRNSCLRSRKVSIRDQLLPNSRCWWRLRDDDPKYDRYTHFPLECAARTLARWTALSSLFHSFSAFLCGIVWCLVLYSVP